MNFYIATSRDGVRWNLDWVYAGRPMIPRGGDGQFDKDLLFPASAIVTHDDRHWLYYCGADERHGTEQVQFPRKLLIGLATLPLDRFVGLTAGPRGGTIVTRPFRVAAEKLVLNADAHGGAIKVEILEPDGTPIPAYSGARAAMVTRIDALRHEPKWEGAGDMASLAGKEIKLRFELQSATLYSFQVSARTPPISNTE